MSEKDMIQVLVQIDKLANTQVLLTEELQRTNKKLENLTSLLGQHEVLKTEISHLNKRVTSLEQSRLWAASIVIGGAILALLKLIYR